MASPLANREEPETRGAIAPDGSIFLVGIIANDLEVGASSYGFDKAGESPEEIAIEAQDTLIEAPKGHSKLVTPLRAVCMGVNGANTDFETVGLRADTLAVLNLV